jgi:trk system potassium uptake protein TrkH
LLWLPVSRQSDRDPITLVEAAFTSTSATCVTGLTVRSTAGDFSTFGQSIILLLIQAGGIGIITVTTYIALSLGSSESLRKTVLVAASVGMTSSYSVRRLLTLIMLTVFGVEAVGFVLLMASNWMGSTSAISSWEASFLSVSAFCNAGFSLREDSLMQFRNVPLFNGTMVLLFVLGGLGFPVLLDVARNLFRHPRTCWRSLNLHSKLMLIGTALLLVAGTAAFLILEWHHSLRGVPQGTKLVAALLHSSSTRTAGFYSTEIRSLSLPTLFATMLLMLVGAGPCSTGGGMKVTSLFVLAMFAWSRFRGSNTASLFHRRISPRSLERAATTVLLFGIAVAVGLICVLVTEHVRAAETSPATFLDTAFEVASALGTVGLSTGVTSSLGDATKVVLMVLMLLGRLGPISVYVALSREEESRHLAFPEEDVLIG